MRNHSNVIASEAKQSIFLSLRGEMDCFAALAMTTANSNLCSVCVLSLHGRCAPRGQSRMRNRSNVIASAAKQSIFLSLRGKMDCFACARNDDGQFESLHSVCVLSLHGCCSPRGQSRMRNHSNVIASAAKQSIFLSLRSQMDCFAALAMTAGSNGDVTIAAPWAIDND